MILTYVFVVFFRYIYINMVKYLQRVSLDVSINWRYVHQDARKTYSEVLKMRLYWRYQKAYQKER